MEKEEKIEKQYNGKVEKRQKETRKHKERQQRRQKSQVYTSSQGAVLCITDIGMLGGVRRGSGVLSQPGMRGGHGWGMGCKKPINNAPHKFPMS